MTVEIVETKLVHVVAVCEALREREREQFAKMSQTPEHLITQEVARSLVSYTGLVNEQPVVMWGARSAGILSEEAYIWLIGTERLTKCPITFLRHSGEAVGLLRQHFKVLHGHVFVDFGCSIKWIEWLGFRLEHPANGMQAFHSE